MSQADHVLFLLRRGWVCGSTFAFDEGIPRYSARFDQLRRQGFQIERRHCEDPHHHHRHGQFYEWRLAAEPGVGGQMTVCLQEVAGVRR